MPTKTIHTEEINEQQVDIVQELAYKIWPQTYAEVLSKDQIDYMLEMMYSIKSLQDQIKNGHRMFIFKTGEQPIGFLTLEHNKDGEGKTKVQKIYLLPEFQGSGLGRMMMDFAAEKALEFGDKSLTLNVNRYNKALGFYEHYGYKITSQGDFDIGHGYLMEDYIMEKQL